MSNKKTNIIHFLHKLNWETIPSSQKTNSYKHTTIALITNLPSDIPVGQGIYTKCLQGSSSGENLLEVDIEPIRDVPENWFFAIRRVS